MIIRPTKQRRVSMITSLAVGGVLIAILLIGQLQAAASEPAAIYPGARSYLYRFDPTAQTFFTIPLTEGAVPIGVALTGTSPAHVWIAEYGLNQIVQVIFTDTAHYVQAIYPVTSTLHSAPYRIAIAGNDVWFTERGANRVGRLDALTGQLSEYYGHGLSSNAGLTDIKVASDGTVWLGAQSTQRLVKLTVSSPSVYAFVEYTDTLRQNFPVAPSFLALDGNDLVWLTAPTASYYRMAQFTPSAQDFIWPTLPTGSLPMGIAATPGFAWLADNAHNVIALVEVGTLTLANSFGPFAHPQEIAAESDHVFWVTQDDGRGGIGRLIYTSTVSYRVDSFAVPTPGLQLTGLAAAPGRGVWFAAYAPERIYLPLTLKEK